MRLISCIVDKQTEEMQTDEAPTTAPGTASGQKQTGDKEKREEEDEESEEDEDALLGDDDDKMEAEMEEKLKIGDHEEDEHKDEGNKVGKTWEKIKELKEGVQEKLKEILPPCFMSGRFPLFCIIVGLSRGVSTVSPTLLLDKKGGGYGILNVL